MGHRAVETITVDYTRTLLGQWRIRVVSPAGSDLLEGEGPLPAVVEQVVMPVVERHGDRVAGEYSVAHTLDGNAAAFAAAHDAAFAVPRGRHHA